MVVTCIIVYAYQIHHLAWAPAAAPQYAATRPPLQKCAVLSQRRVPRQSCRRAQNLPHKDFLPPHAATRSSALPSSVDVAPPVAGARARAVVLQTISARPGPTTRGRRLDHASVMVAIQTRSRVVSRERVPPCPLCRRECSRRVARSKKSNWYRRRARKKRGRPWRPP